MNRAEELRAIEQHVSRNGVNRYGKCFSTYEDEMMLKMAADGDGQKLIGERLGRSWTSIKSRLRRLRDGKPGRRTRGRPGGKPNNAVFEFGGGPIAKMQDRNEAEPLISAVFSGELTEAEAQGRAG